MSARTPTSPPVIESRAVHCFGGWNVWGWDADGHLVYECLHLHTTRHAAEECEENRRSLEEADGQRTTLQIWPTAKGDQWRCTCPFPHKPPVICRNADAKIVGQVIKAHVQQSHGWKVTGVQILGVPAPKKDQK